MRTIPSQRALQKAVKRHEQLRVAVLVDRNLDPEKSPPPRNHLAEVGITLIIVLLIAALINLFI